MAIPLFYGAVIVTLSLYSYLLDVIFYTIKNGIPNGIYYNPLEYIVYYIIAGYLIFPASILYNYSINYLNPVYQWKILTGIITFLILGWLISRDYKFGYLIGKYRVFKNIIMLMLSGLSIELLRIWVVKRRILKKRLV